MTTYRVLVNGATLRGHVGEYTPLAAVILKHTELPEGAILERTFSDGEVVETALRASHRTPVDREGER